MLQHLLFPAPVLPSVFAGGKHRVGLGVLGERVHRRFDGVESVA
jgi:hypothetical protein